jgi:hypothetical protein
MNGEQSRGRFSFDNEVLARAALLAAAALLLLFGFAVGSLAHADDFAANNAVLLDPFDPVPQIRFGDCDYGCGYRCYDGCERHRGFHHPHIVVDERAWCERVAEYDYDTHRWNGAMEHYDNQTNQYDHFMRDRYPLAWHGQPYHDPGDYKGPTSEPCFLTRDGRMLPIDYEWRQDGDHWRYWHNDGWHNDGEDGRWHDGHHDDGHDADHHDDHHDGDHHDDDHHDGAHP